MVPPNMASKGAAMRSGGAPREAAPSSTRERRGSGSIQVGNGGAGCGSSSAWPEDSSTGERNETNEGIAPSAFPSPAEIAPPSLSTGSPQPASGARCLGFSHRSIGKRFDGEFPEYS